jgi:DNA modification methylase
MNNPEIQGDWADNIEGLLKQVHDELDEAFSDLRLDDLASQLGFDFDPDEGGNDKTPPVPKEAISKKGVMYELGNHRLLCGDSTDSDDIARVVDNQPCDLCFTSPPYALGYCVKLRHKGEMAKNENAYGEYEDTADAWPDLMAGFDAAVEPWVEVMAVNIQMLAGNKRNLLHWMSERAERLIDVATWDKGSGQPAMGAGIMNSAFEWIIFLGKAGSTRYIPLSTWRGTVPNIVEISPAVGNKNSDVHGATMPIELAEWVIGTVCDKAQTIVEPFCGTGTTIICCEQMKKKCFAVELDPCYVDVTRQRWATYVHGEDCNWESLTPPSE